MAHTFVNYRLLHAISYYDTNVTALFVIIRRGTRHGWRRQRYHIIHATRERILVAIVLREDEKTL